MLHHVGLRWCNFQRVSEQGQALMKINIVESKQGQALIKIGNWCFCGEYQGELIGTYMDTSLKASRVKPGPGN